MFLIYTGVDSSFDKQHTAESVSGRSLQWDIRLLNGWQTAFQFGQKIAGMLPGLRREQRCPTCEQESYKEYRDQKETPAKKLSVNSPFFIFSHLELLEIIKCFLNSIS
jgi:hypothetical protein